MTDTMKLNELSGLIKYAMTEGANKALSQGGRLPDSFTKPSANMFYGRINAGHRKARGPEKVGREQRLVSKKILKASDGTACRFR
jgi:hypothetical protein